MAEISTPDNEELVSRIYEETIDALAAGRPVSAAALAVHDIEHLLQEVNSGASFEQYFRWASLDELGRIRGELRQVGLDRVLAVLEQAVQVAFPSGVPVNEEAKRDATEWTEDQEDDLGALFPALEDENGHITNVLADYARANGL